MAREQSARGGRGLSVRQLTFIFFGLVGVCGLFFALGYLAGTHNGPGTPVPVVEQTPAPAAFPPPINAPLQDASAANSRQAAVIEQNLKPSGEAPAVAKPEPVKLAASAPEKKAASSQAPSVLPTRPAHGVMVQVAALRTQGDAASLLRTLKTHGYPAVVLSGAASGDGLYRVQVGPFATRDAALRTLHRLSRQGFKPFIRQ